MPSIVRYNPLSLLQDMQRDFNPLLDRDFANTPDLSNVETSQWSPRVDIKEDPSQFIIIADIPGVEPKDIEISMENNVLTIKGTRTLERKLKEEKYSRIERFSGTFYRQFTLPDHVNSEAIKAKGKHGVLEVTIPKKERHVPKKIKVHEEKET
ncbi:MAG: Hsp20/alpha crystallin family protein [Gammaproteobacteria bacterium]|jgi:HSP20 family protein